MYRSQPQKIVATIEARMTSSRLPGKVLLDLTGKPALQQLVERLHRSRYLDEVVVATTDRPTDDPVAKMCRRIGCPVFRGSEDDVLARVLGAAQSVSGDLIVEITGDCPAVDWRHIDLLIETFFAGQYDYVANVAGPRPYPVGFEVQVFPTAVLAEVDRLTQNPVDHEHVSLYIYSHPERYRIHYVEAGPELYRPEIEITLDTAEDYQLIQSVFQALLPEKPDFSALDVIELLQQKPELLAVTRQVKRKYAEDALAERQQSDGGA
jgi:spore coat polysaccharide biosynthesis protein SpsF